MLTCKELHEQITTYVDNRIDAADYRNKVEQHIGSCPDCRHEYEAELMTKMVVRGREWGGGAPAALRQSVEQAIDDIHAERIALAHSHREPGPKPGFFERFYYDYVSPTGVFIAAGLVCLGIYLITGRGPSSDQLIVTADEAKAPPPAKPRTSPENFLNQASKNFRSILDKELGVAVATSDQKEILDYFQKEGITYPTEIIPVRASLAGGVVSKHGPGESTSFAHWVWLKGETVVYFFEVPESALQKGDVFYLTPDALARLDNGEKIWQEFDGNQNLVVFKRQNQIYAVVANVDRFDLQQLVPGL